MKYLVILLVFSVSCNTPSNNSSKDLLAISKKLIGFRLLEERKYEEAKIVFINDYILDSNNYLVALGLYAVYNNTDKIDSAKYWIYRSVNQDSTINNISARISLAMTYENQNKVDSALFQYQICIKQDSMYLDLRYKIAQIYLQKNQIRNAIIELDKIRKIDKEFLNVSILLDSLKNS
jgi:tetratricopeptide (TPR) repeat protein